MPQRLIHIVQGFFVIGIVHSDVGSRHSWINQEIITSLIFRVIGSGRQSRSFWKLKGCLFHVKRILAGLVSEVALWLPKVEV